jgi:hypothetical protein
MFLLACASAGKGAEASATASSDTKSSATDQSRLSSDEITAANLPTAYDLVDRLRRPWLRRDAVTGGDVVVYMDEQNVGGAGKLRDIPSVDVAELQYMPNDAAVQRWGSDIKGSVIVVTRRR